MVVSLAVGERDAEYVTDEVDEKVGVNVTLLELETELTPLVVGEEEPEAEKVAVNVGDELCVLDSVTVSVPVGERDGVRLKDGVDDTVAVTVSDVLSVALVLSVTVPDTEPVRDLEGVRVGVSDLLAVFEDVTVVVGVRELDAVSVGVAVDVYVVEKLGVNDGVIENVGVTE